MRYAGSVHVNQTILLRLWVVAQQASRIPQRAPPQGPSLGPTPVQIPLERRRTQLSQAIQIATS
jgi:hypothetical protein